MSVKYKITTIGLLTAIVGFPATATAQPVTLDTARTTLHECIAAGLERNYDIRIAANRQQITENNYSAGNAGFLPNLVLNASYGGTLNNTDQHLADGTSRSYDNVLNQNAAANVALDWTLFAGLRVQTTYKRLRELQAAGELETLLAVEKFITAIASEYYNYVRQNLRREHLRYTVELSRERIRIARLRYGVGSGSRPDLQQAQVDYNSDSSTYVRQNEAVKASLINLNRLMATDDLLTYVAADTLIRINPAFDRGAFFSRVMRENTSLLLALSSRTVSELDLRILKSQNLPTLRGSAGYGYTGNFYGSGGSGTLDRQSVTGLNYGLTLGFPLFQGMNRTREQRNARITVQNRELAIEQLKLDLEASFENLWYAYTNNMELIKLESENLATAQDNYSIALDRYKIGEIAPIQLREAQNSLLAAEERLLTARYNTKLCEISLLQISAQATRMMEW